VNLSNRVKKIRSVFKFRSEYLELDAAPTETAGSLTMLEVGFLPIGPRPWHGHRKENDEEAAEV
jgi:hypothetical protein